MELQLDWDIDRLQADFAQGPDTAYVMARLSVVPAEGTAAGNPQRVLEIAAAEALHSCKLSLRGMESYVVEPSPVMLSRARERMVEYGADLVLIRGVAETLPSPVAVALRRLCAHALFCPVLSLFLFLLSPPSFFFFFFFLSPLFL